MVIIVTGGRNYKRRDLVFAALSKLKAENMEIVVFQGECPTGADRWAREWCAENGLPAFGCRAPWTKVGKAAGPLRNRYMAMFAHADACLCFPGGPGTASMRDLAAEHHIRLLDGEKECTP